MKKKTNRMKNIKQLYNYNNNMYIIFIFNNVFIFFW